jgi:hypothetical protein
MLLTLLTSLLLFILHIIVTYGSPLSPRTTKLPQPTRTEQFSIPTQYVGVTSEMPTVNRNEHVADLLTAVKKAHDLRAAVPTWPFGGTNDDGLIGNSPLSYSVAHPIRYDTHHLRYGLLRRHLLLYTLLRVLLSPAAFDVHPSQGPDLRSG